MQPLWRTVWKFLKNLKIELLYDPAIPLLDIYSEELKTGIQTDTSAWVFVARLATIAQSWKQPNCPSTDK